MYFPISFLEINMHRCCTHLSVYVNLNLNFTFILKPTSSTCFILQLQQPKSSDFFAQLFSYATHIAIA